jgi:hypothetical protein
MDCRQTLSGNAHRILATKVIHYVRYAAARGRQGPLCGVVVLLHLRAVVEVGVPARN